ncbi:hypothetical protein ACIPW5_33870 [Streptomyces sp. NPDC090077]|uniref:hypothetical protein n=1 Tax=Streptomyces sp. NPDC090077 TaxID=3365938 RepID=UPI00381542D5
MPDFSRPRCAPPHEPRTLSIELDGVLRQVPGTYHRFGRLVGRFITAPCFRAVCAAGGECPAPMRMALHRPLATTDRRLIVLDDKRSRWVMSFATCYAGRRCVITGFYS